MQATSEQFVSDSWETLIYIISVFLKLILCVISNNKDILHILGYNYNLFVIYDGTCELGSCIVQYVNSLHVSTSARQYHIRNTFIKYHNFMINH